MYVRKEILSKFSHVGLFLEKVTRQLTYKWQILYYL
jgi:hypothetical protein